MDKTQLGKRVRELRNRQGMSQEFLAEASGLSLRTIQRIENGASNPTGESLKRLANALEITPDELIDWSVKEDQKSLVFLNLSALNFLFFPLLGILVPFILWTSKKGKVRNINPLGRSLINFEITWTLLLFFIPVVLLLLSFLGITGSITFNLLIKLVGVLYLFNLIFILLNAVRIHQEKQVIFWPQIRFLR